MARLFLFVVCLSPFVVESRDVAFVKSVEGEALLVRPDGDSQIVRSNLILRARDKIYTQNEAKLSLVSLSGSLMRIYGNSAVELLPSEDVGSIRRSIMSLNLIRGVFAGYFIDHTDSVRVRSGNYAFTARHGQFVSFASLANGAVYLSSVFGDVKLKNEFLSLSLDLPSGKSLQDFRGDFLNYRDHIKDVEFAFRINLDRKDLDFEPDALRSLSVSVQLIRSSNRQNYAVSIPVHFFLSEKAIESPREVVLNRRGYAYVEIRIPPEDEVRYVGDSLSIVAFADLPNDFTILPGTVSIPFK